MSSASSFPICCQLQCSCFKSTHSKCKNIDSWGEGNRVLSPFWCEKGKFLMFSLKILTFL